MLAGLDMTDQHGWIAYQSADGKICFKECVWPWKLWQMTTSRDERRFEKCLASLKGRLESAGLGSMDMAAMVVPYSFTYPQIRKVKEIAAGLGIRITDTANAGELHTFFRCVNESNKKKSHKKQLDFCCILQDDYFEMSLTEIDGKCTRSLGTVGLQFTDGWQSLSDQIFEKRISSEVRQFLRDQGFEQGLRYLSSGRPVIFDDKIPAGYGAASAGQGGNSAGYGAVPAGRSADFTPDRYELRVYSIGQSNPVLDEIIFRETGKIPEARKRHSAVGALYQAKIFHGDSQMRSFFRTSSSVRNIWAGLGKNGEHGIVLNRYTKLPARSSIKLLLSTETVLHVYEGNFYNYKFDTHLAAVDLAGLDAQEGKEIECTIDADSRLPLRLTVTNHHGSKIVTVQV